MRALKRIFCKGLLFNTKTLLFILVFFSISYSKEFTDQVGRKIEIVSTPNRIISFAPNITEIIFALDKGHLLKGVSIFSNYPKKTKFIPKIGSYINLDTEKILMLKPDICFAIKDGNPKTKIETMEKLGLLIYVMNPSNIYSVMDSIYETANILNASKKAHIIVSDIKKRIAKVKKKAKKNKKKPKVFFQIGINPIISVGKGTYIDELIKIAGGDNIAKNIPQYPKFSFEQVISHNPDIIIISSMAQGVNFENIKKKWLEWQSISEIKKNKIFLVNSDIFNRPSPRLIDALELLSNIIETFE